MQQNWFLYEDAASFLWHNEVRHQGICHEVTITWTQSLRRSAGTHAGFNGVHGGHGERKEGGFVQRGNQASVGSGQQKLGRKSSLPVWSHRPRRFPASPCCMAIRNPRRRGVALITNTEIALLQTLQTGACLESGSGSRLWATPVANEPRRSLNAGGRSVTLKVGAYRDRQDHEHPAVVVKTIEMAHMQGVTPQWDNKKGDAPWRTDRIPIVTRDGNRLPFQGRGCLARITQYQATAVFGPSAQTDPVDFDSICEFSRMASPLK